MAEVEVLVEEEQAAAGNINKTTMNKLQKFLSQENLKNIEKIITEEELKTSSEICVSIKYKLPLFKKNIEKYSLTLFKKYKIFKTKNRNGILILFVLKTKQFHILFDEGIYKKISREYLNTLTLDISNQIKNKNLLDGIIYSIKELNKVISYNFPIEKDDTNELSNLKI